MVEVCLRSVKTIPRESLRNVPVMATECEEYDSFPWYEYAKSYEQ